MEGAETKMVHQVSVMTGKQKSVLERCAFDLYDY